MLTRAIEDFEAGMRMPSWHPAIALAELRIRQGRLADAEMLLLGKDGHLQALLPAAHLHLARGDHDLARATADPGPAGDRRRPPAGRRPPRRAGGHRARRSATWRRRPPPATTWRPGPRGSTSSGLQARVAAVRARVLAAAGDIAGAIGTMEAALDRLPPAGVPLLRATLLVDLVRLHDRAGNRAAARVEAGQGGGGAGRARRRPPRRRRGPARARRRAAAGERHGHAAAPRDAQPGGPRLGRRLRRHAVPAAATPRACGTSPSWCAARASSGTPSTSSTGWKAWRVGDLAVDRRQLGDAGELVDAQARTAYRHRIEALRAEIDDALDAGRRGPRRGAAGRARPARRPAGPGVRAGRTEPPGVVGGRSGPG